MNVVVGSMFRDSTGYLETYIAQIHGLRDLLEARGDKLRVVAVENDSQDDTHLRLDDWGGNVFCDLTLIKVHDDCPYYRSIDDPKRWRHLAWVANHVLEDVDDRDDVLLYVESDLGWEPAEMLQLIDHTRLLPAVSCPNYAFEKGGRYYDIWGSRKDGRRFSPHRPYHPDWSEELMTMDSVASVLAVRADIARKTRFGDTNCFIGWCEDIRSQGHTIWYDPSLCVIHP